MSSSSSLNVTNTHTRCRRRHHIRNDVHDPPLGLNLTPLSGKAAVAWSCTTSLVFTSRISTLCRHVLTHTFDQRPGSVRLPVCLWGYWLFAWQCMKTAFCVSSFLSPNIPHWKEIVFCVRKMIVGYAEVFNTGWSDKMWVQSEGIHGKCVA
jgi:hypothetical protein